MLLAEREVPTVPELRTAEPDERVADVAPERLTLEARLADAAREAEVLRPAVEVRTEEPRAEEALPDATERVWLPERTEALRGVEEPRMGLLPSRCPTCAAREGCQRCPPPHM